MDGLYKFSGAGNDFIIADARDRDLSGLKTAGSISRLCHEFRTDGMMFLSAPAVSGTDFSMEYFNPDGSGGMMCGNGARCIVAFAGFLGMLPASDGGLYHFMAPDGIHTGEILESAPSFWTVRVGMRDVKGISPVLGGWFLDTGTRHLVKFIDDVEAADVDGEGSTLRHDPAFAPQGTNVNFVSVMDKYLKVRTFEKGVERETLACGTGLTASALAMDFVSRKWSGDVTSYSGHTLLRARKDSLTVDFTRVGPEEYRDIYLTGPVENLGPLY